MILLKVLEKYGLKLGCPNIYRKYSKSHRRKDGYSAGPWHDVQFTDFTLNFWTPNSLQNLSKTLNKNILLNWKLALYKIVHRKTVSDIR